LRRGRPGGGGAGRFFKPRGGFPSAGFSAAQLPLEQPRDAEILTLAQGERHLFVEHVLVHAGLVARRLAGRLARIAHAFQHHLQEQRLHLLGHRLDGCGEAGAFLSAASAFKSV
jgi:hypothetical protein